MVNPSPQHDAAARNALEAIAPILGGISIGSQAMLATEYVANYPELCEFLAYFLKENVVWTSPIEEDRIPLLTDERRAIAELVHFLDSAPWLSQIATYDRRWAAVEFLIAAKFIVFQVRRNVFARTSREDEHLRVPLFCLQPDATVLPSEVERFVAPYRVDPDEANKRRAALLVDLGPATPQIGPSNTGRLLESVEGKKNIVIRQVMYSGRTAEKYVDSNNQPKVLKHEELLKTHGNNILIKLLILSPAATPPFDEGTWDEANKQPGPKLKANLVAGLLRLREMRQLEFRRSRLQVRLYGDKLENGLFRGLIVEHSGQIQAAQFCVWDVMNQRGTHGEYGETTGSTNLARLHADYFDRVFSDSIPLYKRHYFAWAFDTFKGPEFAAMVSVIGFLIFLLIEGKGSLASMGAGEWINLCGFAFATWLAMKEPVKRLRRLRQKDMMEWRKYNNKWMREYRDKVAKEKGDMELQKDKLEIGYLRLTPNATDRYSALSNFQVEDLITDELQRDGN